MHTPEEHATAKKMIYRTGIDPREYVARHAEADDVATDMIRQWAKTMSGVPALRLLKIAASMIGNLEHDVLVSTHLLLSAETPDEFETAADDLCDEAMRFAQTHSGYRWVPED
jgi:hypothetical protein